MAADGADGAADDDVELDPERRQFVLETHARLASASYYELLEVAPDAETKAIKRAYFKLAAFLHPDRHFGKKLGRFQPMMKAIFARITEAHDALASAERRAAYDARLGLAPRAPGKPAARPTAPAAGGSPAAPASATTAATAARATPAASTGRTTPPATDAARQAAMAALKQRFLEGRGKSRQHAEAGARASAAGDFVAAAEAYRAALQFAPDDPALRAAHQEASRAASERLHESRQRKALLEERYGHWPEAAASWRLVVEARPDDTAARERLEHALARAKAART